MIGAALERPQCHLRPAQRARQIDSESRLLARIGRHRLAVENRGHRRTHGFQRPEPPATPRPRHLNHPHPHRRLLGRQRHEAIGQHLIATTTQGVQPLEVDAIQHAAVAHRLIPLIYSAVLVAIQGTPAAVSVFPFVRRATVSLRSLVASAEPAVVPLGVAKTGLICTAVIIGMILLHRIVLPTTDTADVVGVGDGLVPTTRTSVSLDDVHHGICSRKIGTAPKLLNGLTAS